MDGRGVSAARFYGYDRTHEEVFLCHIAPARPKKGEGTMQGNYRRRRNESAEVFTMVLGFRFWNNGDKVTKIL